MTKKIFVKMEWQSEFSLTFRNTNKNVDEVHVCLYMCEKQLLMLHVNKLCFEPFDMLRPGSIEATAQWGSR